MSRPKDGRPLLAYETTIQSDKCKQLVVD